MKDDPSFIYFFFFIQFNFFCNLFFSILVFGNYSFFSLASIPSATGFLVLFPSFVDILSTSVSVSGIQFSSKSFDNDKIEYYTGLPDLNVESNTEVDKFETQLGISRSTGMF